MKAEYAAETMASASAEHVRTLTPKPNSAGHEHHAELNHFHHGYMASESAFNVEGKGPDVSADPSVLTGNALNHGVEIFPPDDK